ncbi:hypothetical protein FB45DRAFT_858857 [Roridomyces roridus]|uniref:Uncharacterized protein n=1 Tax=Roridomyces roridus TaxID=1738132 RepID=A0AAD7CI90_9AGAR|nr:hypothetical protein FB45DRAFT_858857 [Roridomyces roridus]
MSSDVPWPIRARFVHLLNVTFMAHLDLKWPTSTLEHPALLLRPFQPGGFAGSYRSSQPRFFSVRPSFGGYVSERNIDVVNEEVETDLMWQRIPVLTSSTCIPPHPPSLRGKTTNKPMLPDNASPTEKKREAQCEASARYREKSTQFPPPPSLQTHLSFTQALSQGSRCWPAARRQVRHFLCRLSYSSNGLRRREELKHDEEAKERAREARARYRENNREILAKKQRLVRKRAFIKKHGVHAYIQRRFDAPMPMTQAPSVQEDVSEGDEDWDGYPNARPLISPYDDPLFKRW